MVHVPRMEILGRRRDLHPGGVRGEKNMLIFYKNDCAAGSHGGDIHLQKQNRLKLVA